ncbi:M6 family metalloprotease domain-containing protein [Fundidesulfovibrio agrisoli]|uniref:M6 family metalloprotease domain-containing protein n=1 Tax=Fundidesulfovibrio agrisoli TaxID=2922717 RepID=UPI001FAD9851|nr:M6 family metalloprotease domain-containing protein [Fundidesulfovibrio agrisoli]
MPFLPRILAAVAILSLAVNSLALAGPANPFPVEAEQPDGSKLTVRIRGDEFQNWTETTDGYTLVRDKANGYFEYALPSGPKNTKRQASGETFSESPGLVPSGLIPGRHAPPADGMHLRPAPDAAKKEGYALGLRLTRDANWQAAGVQAGSAASTAAQSAAQSVAVQSAANPWTPTLVQGQKKMLIVLVAFANRALSTTNQAWYDRVFSTAPGVKSVANFYKDNSHSKLAVTPINHTQNGNATPGVVNVTIASNHPNYGGNYTYPAETAWLNQALAAAAPYVDFASLDANNDGSITPSEAVIYFIPAGYEASGTALTPSIWAHAWGGAGVLAGGKTLTNWAMNGELNVYSRQHPMGVIAHEMGHQMCGMPDLYDTSYTNYGLGMFSIMSFGSWGADTGEDPATTPVTFDAWSRAYCIWDTVRTTGINGHTRSFGPALSDTTLKLVDTGLSTTEYFLAENRNCEGWDKGIRYFRPGYQGGLLILHVDNAVGTPGVGNPGNNDINTYVAGSHQGVTAVQASSAYNILGPYGAGGSYGDQTDLFYLGNVTNAFTPASTPASSLYNGQATHLGLKDISFVGSTMTATIVSRTNLFLPLTILLGN